MADLFVHYQATDPDPAAYNTFINNAAVILSTSFSTSGTDQTHLLKQSIAVTANIVPPEAGVFLSRYSMVSS